jgi:hypothetical protein
MWIVRLALRRPYTFVVMGLAILLLGVFAIATTPTDIFPEIEIPVVSVIWNYDGLTTEDMASRITTFSEYTISSAVSDVRSIESHTYPGVGVIKIYFQPNVNIEGALAQVTAVSQTILRRMPPGAVPPFILQYNASSVPIIQLALSGKGIPEAQLYDYGIYRIRQQVAPIQGITLPLPYGGKPQATLTQSRAALEQSKANESFARVTAERFTKLERDELVAHQDADEKRTGLAAAQATTAVSQANVDAMQANLGALEASVEAARATVAASEANVQRLMVLQSFQRVEAPFAGIITARGIDRGALITSGSGTGAPLFRIAHVENLRIFVNVPPDVRAVDRAGPRRAGAGGRIPEAGVRREDREHRRSPGSRLAHLAHGGAAAQ